MALRFDVEAGEVITIGKSRITVESKNGRRTRVRIDSDEDVMVKKPEEENKPELPLLKRSVVSV